MIDEIDKREFRIISYIAFVVLVLLIINSFLGDISFRLMYMNTKLSGVATETLDPKNTYPTLTHLKEKDQEFIPVRTNKRETYALKTMAEYSVTGVVVATNTNFFLRDVMRTPFDEVCLMDIGLVWGEIADKNYIKKHLRFKSTKTLGQARQLSVSTPNYQKMPYKWNYVSSHMSHTHLIPGSVNVMSALLKIKKNDIVKLDGYLVDIYTDKGDIVARSSLSNSDTNSTSRGYGACEDLYVTQVQIGNKIYR